MKKLRWQLLVVVLALIAIGVLLLGQQPTLLPGVVPVVEPASGGVYTEALIGSMGRLNPLLDYYNPVDQDVNRLLYSSLISFDSLGLPYGDLAESWGISQDGTVYNLSIRSEAVWHDGEPVTSEDIIFTVKLLQDPELPLPSDLQAFWSQVEARVLDEKTLQFRLPEPFAPFLDYLTFGVLPKHLLDGISIQEMIDADFNLSPIGSGPYCFNRLIVEDGQIKGVVLSVFEDYYADVPFIEEVGFRYYPDPYQALAAYRQEEVMGINQVPEEILADALAEPELNLYSSRLPRLALVYLNLGDAKMPFFQDPDVRRAMLMAINRQWIIDRILAGQAIQAHGPILPKTWAYYDGIEQIPFDPDAAVQLLREAGYTFPAQGGNVRAKDGIAIAFEMVYPNQGAFPQIAEVIRDSWEQIGIKVELVPVTYQELLQDYLEPRNYQVALAELNLSPYPDPDPYPFWHQTQAAVGQNYSQWDDRQASEYLEQARVEVDSAERLRRYRNFQVRFTDQMPALPLYHPVFTYAVDASVQGVRVGPIFITSDRFDTQTLWYLLARRSVELVPTSTP